MKDIVIVTGDANDVDAKTLLRIFKRVYIVLVPDEDSHGFLSLKTLYGMNIDKASHCVLTSFAAETEDEVEKFDNHQKCTRMVASPP